MTTDTEPPTGEPDASTAQVDDVDNQSRDAGDAVDDGAAVDSALPRWFHLGVIATSLFVAIVGSFGLLLAINDWYRTWLVLAVSAPLTAIVVVGLWFRRPAPDTTRAGHIGAALALAIAVGYTAFAGATPANHMLVNRDPAAYQIAGRWIAGSGSIDVDAADAFEGIDGLRYRGGATYDEPAIEYGPAGQPLEAASGNVQFQFNHLSSALLATAYDVGGTALFFRVPAALAGLGLLLVYALAVKASRRPLLALAAPLLLGASMPLLYVARDTFSEPTALVLLWAGMLVLLDAHERPRTWVGVAGGVLLGGVAGARVDALIYVAVMFPMAAVSIGAASTRRLRANRARTWAVAVVTTVAVSTVGFVDLTRHAGQYAEGLRDDLELLRLAVLASLVTSLLGLAIWLAWPALRTLARRVRRPAAWVGAGAVVLALLALWLVRPTVQEVMVGRQNPTTRDIQKRDGLTVEMRNYAEQSLRWMAWYLGVPALIAAIAGLGIATWRTIRASAKTATVAVAGITLAGGAVYWWDPSITPSQPWASRRFIPAVLPGLTVMVVVAIAALAAVPIARRIAPTVRTVGAAALVGLLVVPAALTTWPVRWQRTQDHFLRPVAEACDGMRGNPAVVVVGNWETTTLMPTLRSWCGVPVAGQTSGFDTSNANDVARTLRGRGYDLYLVSASRAIIEGWAPAVDAVVETTSGVPDRHTVEETLDRPPDRYLDPDEAYSIEDEFRLYRIEVPTDRG